MDVKEIMRRFFYEMTLNELRLMNKNELYPNITYNSLLYMDLIAYKDHCTVSYLAGKLQISKAAVTIKVNDLIRQGFVEKTRSDADKRVYYLNVTPKIRADYKLYDKILSKVEEAIASKYSDEEIYKFSEILNLIIQYYEESDEDL